jgi:hypothetical protein
MMKHCLRTAAMIAMVAIVAAFNVENASASITYSGSSGNLAAKVTFDNSVSGVLTVTLENVGGDVLVPADILTAVFFDLAPGTGLTKVSAVVAPGSSIVYDNDGTPATTGPGTVVSGEWAYKTGLGGSAPGNTGISSSGLSPLFGGGDRFSTAASANLQGPDSPAGFEYGLLSALDNPTTGNKQVKDGQNDDGFIKNAVVFTFNTTGVFDLTRISNVSFQYGTSLTEPNYPGEPPEETPTGTPEPSTLLMGALALAGFGVARFRSLKKS